MSLTEHEMQTWMDIESRLAVEDPYFARKMAGLVNDAGTRVRYRPLLLAGVIAGAAAYIVSALLVVLAVDGTMRLAALGMCALLQLLIPVGVIAMKRQAGRAENSCKVRASLAPGFRRSRYLGS